MEPPLPDEKSPAEHLADAQDTLYTLEESARGLRAQMRGNGWSDEASEHVAAHWFVRSIEVGMAYAEGKRESKWDTLVKLATVVVALLALPTVVILTIAGWRWATG